MDTGGGIWGILALDLLEDVVRVLDAELKNRWETSEGYPAVSAFVPVQRAEELYKKFGIFEERFVPSGRYRAVIAGFDVSIIQYPTIKSLPSE